MHHSSISNLHAKEKIAQQLIPHVRDGQVIGVGSGSTALVALKTIAAVVREKKFHCLFIPTSHEIEMACAAEGLSVTTLMSAVPDWYFDGVDEIDPARNMIKGRGGALFREKLVMSAAARTFILADNSKFVDHLGAKFPVPVEVYPQAIPLVEKRLKSLGATEIKLRPATGKDGPIITEQGNLLLDARFTDIPLTLEWDIKSIPGVLDSGLFMGYSVEIISG